MSLRLTGLSSYYLFQRSLTLNNQALFKSSEQLATQKRIQRPSDDPEGLRSALSFKDALAQITQYRRNLGVADRTIRATEGALTEVVNLLNRAKELAIQGNNGTLSSDAREALGEEVHQLFLQLKVLGNTQVNGEYIFAGTKTNTIPFDDTAVPAYVGGDIQKSIPISDSATLTIQSDGEYVFKGDGGATTEDLFDTLADLETALRTDDIDSSSPSGVGVQIGRLTTGLQQVINELSAIGAKTNRIEAVEAQHNIQEETFLAFVSDIEDIDLAEATLEFQRAQIALQATLGSAGSVLNLPSLMDFIGR